MVLSFKAQVWFLLSIPSLSKYGRKSVSTKDITVSVWWWRRVYQQGFHESSVKMWNQTDDLLSSYSSTKRFGWTKTQCTNVDHSLQKIIDISLAKTSSSLSFPFPSTLWHQNLLIIFHIHYMWNEEGFILIVRPWLRRK